MPDKRALIIDDDSANRSIWELVLTDRGYDVTSASDLSGGYNSVLDNVSLYLVDYHLPDGRGTDLVQYVKQINPTCVVVMVSMDDDADVIRESMRAGGNVFIVKPASPMIMNQVLNEIDSGQLDANARQLINRNGRRTYAA
jgi:two-component system response regulator PilR (NtrC family)